MAQFDLYGAGLGYVVDVQADLLYRLATRAVVPLERRPQLPKLRDLTPLLEFEGEDLLLVTYELRAVQKRQLHHKIGSLARYRDEIRLALDILLVGF